LKNKSILLVFFLFIYLFCTVGSLYAQTTIKNYPRGKKMSCEVTYLIEYYGLPTTTSVYEVTVPYVLVVMDPMAGFSLAVAAARVSRSLLWNEWLKHVEFMEKEPRVLGVKLRKVAYWTDETVDRKVVTEFIRNNVSSLPGDNVGGIPSDFIIVQK